MLEAKAIDEVSIKKGKVNSLTFLFKNKLSEREKYTAKISPEKITLRGIGTLGGIYSVAEYDKKTGKTSWYLDHRCGAKGFGLESGDVCYGCSSPNQMMEETSDNKHILMTSGEYTEELSKVLSSGINEYCQKLETGVESYISQ